MLMQNTLLTVATEQAAPDAVAADATAEAVTTDATATTDAPADSADISVETSGDVTAESTDVTNITINAEGQPVIVNPETGEETALTEDQIAALTGMATEQSVLPVQQPITPAITGIYIVYAIFCVGLIALILSQKKRSAAFGNGMSNGGSDTYWSKNKGRSMEGQLDKITKIAFGIFLAFTFVLTII